MTLPPLLLAACAALLVSPASGAGTLAPGGPSAGAVPADPAPLAGAMSGGGDAADLGALSDYPTRARADYVFACMAVNGRTEEALDRCSCSIDVIASILGYGDYVSAETVLRMRQTTGERAALFRGTAATSAPVEALRRAQAEAEMLCF